MYYKMLMDIDKAIVAEYAELKLQGNIRKKIIHCFSILSYTQLWQEPV